MIVIEIRNVINKLELPSDALLGDTVVEIIGKNSLYVENYKRIIAFCDEYIEIQCKAYRLKVCGCSLQILYYNNVDLKISGVLNEISFC